MLKRILIVFGILVVLGSVYAWFYGAQTMFVLEARYLGWKNPVLNMTPQELTEPWLARQALGRVSYFGYEFETPWTDVDEQNLPVKGNSVSIHFKSGNQLFFSVSPARELVNTVLSTANEEGIFPQILGEDALQSDYNLTRRVLDATPGQIKLSSTRRDAVGTLASLTFKATVIRPADSGIFSYRVKGFRCIQFGKPEARPRIFYVQMYSDDRTLTFGFTQVPGTKAAPLSQADVDSIVRSVRKVG